MIIMTFILDKIRKKARPARNRKITIQSCMVCPYMIKKTIEGRYENYCLQLQEKIRGYEHILIPLNCPLEFD
jgi:hypothetical protein